MIDRETFEIIKEKYGNCASWAIWSDVGEKPKSNIGDLSVLDPSINQGLFDQLKPDIVFVGLNVSRVVIHGTFANFHDPRHGSNDFKLRHALKDTRFWGGYMTDIIKGFDQPLSVKVMDYLKTNKSFEEENIKKFREELDDLGSKKPTIIVFGNDAFNILNKNLNNEYKIIKICHYAYRINKEKYKERVESVLNF